MGNKKNIDQLFQEQLKDFEATPNTAMWDSIQAKLDEDDPSKKRMPLWIFYSGLVATAIVFIAVSISVLSTDENIVAVPKSEIQLREKCLFLIKKVTR